MGVSSPARLAIALDEMTKPSEDRHLGSSDLCRAVTVNDSGTGDTDPHETADDVVDGCRVIDDTDQQMHGCFWLVDV